MMEAMIPSQDGTSLWTFRKIKEAKEAKKKREIEKKEKEKKREGAMLLSFFHTCASK